MFELGSLSTLILSIILTFLVFFITIVSWKRLSKARWGSVLGRILLLLLIQTLTLSSVGIALNRSGEYYSNWNDLLGKSTNLEKIATPTKFLSRISAADINASKRTPGGSLIIKKIITGADSKISNTVYVVLPPKIASQLDANPSKANLESNYQIVELFSGYPGVPQTWIGSMQGIKTLEELQLSGKIGNTIAIIPTMNVNPRKDTECLNFKNGLQVETWLSSDMKSFAQKYLGIDNRPWATFGYSAGGWCAVSIAVRHPDQYSRAVSLAGYFEPLFETSVKSSEKSASLKKYDLVHLLNTQLINVKILVIAGKQDHFAWDSAQKFIARLKSNSNVEFIPIANGGHNPKSWIPLEAPAFEWIDRNNK